LVALGRRRLAFVGGGLGVRQVSDRVLGARDAARTAGVELEVIETSTLSFEEGERVGSALLAAGLDALPDGIFAGNDLVALGLIKALYMTSGVSIPERVAVIGYDDIAPARHSLLPLASVRQPTDELGRVALEMLVRRIRGGRSRTEQVLLDPQLVVRDSAAD
jgi:LacI family transcriptional regulator